VARPRKFDEAKVMRAVRDRFWATGYAGTSLDDLTEATRLGRGSLYGAFGDKHALFLRTLDEYCDDAVGGVRAELRGSGDAYERLAAHVRATAASVVADADRRGCLLAKSAAELAGTDADVAARVARGFADLHAVLTECVAEAQRDGALDPDADPAALAGLVLTVLRGLEALGKGGAAPSVVTGAAEQALALLPRPAPVKHPHG
jgi:AcrR family transcriptional regulator